ncbi:hypothetical protein ACFO4E_04500 [Nocardiopsis mangrovi]|uniref:Peptidase inhibitor family I36 n=1 Tax=Nocardiopsis mangrovi TaxID=1179818 RepID=A0ABV9DSU2_9ACTN
MKIRGVHAFAACAVTFSAVALGAPAAVAGTAAEQPEHCVLDLGSGELSCAGDMSEAREMADVGTAAVVAARLYDGTGYSNLIGEIFATSPCTPSYDREWEFATLGPMNNRISSLRTYNQCDIKLYNGTNFTGAESTWIDQSSNLGNIGTGWSNRASSLEVS